MVPDPDFSASAEPAETPGRPAEAPDQSEKAPSRVDPRVIASGGTRRPFGIVPMAALFYGGLLALTGLWSGLAGDSLLYATPEAARDGVIWGRDVGSGLAAAGLTIALSKWLTARTRWGDRLARTQAALIGPLTGSQCLLLAGMSGLAEEALFRGMLQPRIGLVAASLLFGLAHFVPRREILPWTLLSIGAGFLLGGLFAATGNLVAPVVAHMTINAVNLRLLSDRYAPPR